MAENIIIADFELILARLANRTHPVSGQFIKGSARRNGIFRIAPLRVINISANKTYVFLHKWLVSLHSAVRYRYSALGTVYLAWQSIHDTGPDGSPAFFLSLWQAMQF